MSTATTHYRQVLKITDEALLTGQTGPLNLYCSLSTRHIRLAVADAQRNKILSLEDYELSTIFSQLQLTEQLNLLADENESLTKTHWNEIRVAIKNQNFTYIPETLFDPSAAQHYLNLHAEPDEFHEEILTYRHPKIEAVSIFTIDSYLIKWFEETFTRKKLRFMHQTSPLIEGILNEHQRSLQKKTYLYIEQNNLSILLAQDGRLEFCNQFYYASAEDFIYFTLLVMQEQKLNPDQDPVTVWGDLTHDSALFTILRKYIRNVTLGKKPQNMTFSYKFDDVFDHRFFDLYNLHLCE
ncbi:DUF3822 family protein [Adhaeribacter sp. BT258]|uniref:DUF3822 family protein n=1 Tax=Adhaeribacter terrigena TaxID=2793070 RepID=A0ABS1C5P6_9BACT|nr:DUF3822 family protein [Adhaeribacter terrigena]MBK0404711.1 DUF3822 family protein [Adhaeribacter terrigena]